MMTSLPLRVVACVAILVAAVNGAEDKTKGKVIALDASNFETFIEDTPLVLVEFYA